jgi:FixJ family two-component response regulator
MNEPLVFVLDDEESVRKALSRLLDSAGYRSECFAAPEQFLARAPHDGPSCLILDLQMPGMTGLELQARLSESGHALPIVFLSGHGDIPTSVRAIRQGALDFLSKPIKSDKLLAAVEAALERDRAGFAERRELEELIARYRTLTPREAEVFALVVQGLLNKQVASRLQASEKTIKAHRGRLASRYVRDFERKWLGPGEPGEPLVGTPDLQSLADLANSVAVVREMRWSPAGRRLLFATTAAVLLPMFPLLLFQYPLTELAQRFLRQLVGI